MYMFIVFGIYIEALFFQIRKVIGKILYIVTNFQCGKFMLKTNNFKKSV